MNIRFLKSNRRMVIILAAALLLADAAVAAVFFQLYRISEQNILDMWRNNTGQTAQEVNYYLTKSMDAVSFSAKKVNEMMEKGLSNEEIGQYLIDETEIYAATINDNVTGVYGYCRGEYLDGSGWIPPEDYQPKERPWYIVAIQGKGETVLSKPYMNLQTHAMMMSVSRMLADGESVISMDVFLDGVQAIAESRAEAPEVESVLVMDRNGFVVAHSDREDIGKDYNREGDAYQESIYKGVSGKDSTSFQLPGENGRERAFCEPVNDSWRVVTVLNEGALLRSLLYIYVISGVALLLVNILILTVFLNMSRKQRETEQLAREVRAVADIYVDMLKVDFEKDEMTCLRRSDLLKEFMPQDVAVFSTDLYHAAEKMSADQSRELLLLFLDQKKLLKRLKDTHTITHEFLNVQDHWIRLRFIVTDRKEDGHPTRALLAFESIDEDKRRQENLLRLSETDLMTGIRNRGSGEARIKKLMSDGTRGMFCLLDADRFKSVNDDFGHSVGDKVIIALADCLRKTFRDSDVVFRLGGDEFAVFAEGVTEPEVAERMIHRLFDQIDHIIIPELKGRKISVSMGASFYPANKNDSFEALYTRADAGTYASKAVEGNQVTFTKG